MNFFRKNLTCDVKSDKKLRLYLLSRKNTFGKTIEYPLHLCKLQFE